MARETWPAILMITSSPAPDSASSVTKVCRLSCHRPTTLASSRTLVHAVLSDVTGRVGSFGWPFPAGNTYHSGLRSPKRRMYQAGGVWSAARTVSFNGITRPVTTRPPVSSWPAITTIAGNRAPGFSGDNGDAIRAVPALRLEGLDGVPSLLHGACHKPAERCAAASPSSP